MGMYNKYVKNNDELDWEETTAVKVKKGKKIPSEFDSSDSERFNETLSDWDIDVTESLAANKTTVAYTAPKRKAAPKPDPEDYDDEYYEEEEEEQLQEVDDDGEDVSPTPPVEAPTPELPPKSQAAKQGANLRPGATKSKPQEPPAEKQKRFQKKTNEKAN